MNTKKERDDFKLEVPLDASGIKDFKPDQAVKVVAKDRKGSFYSQTIELNAEGQGVATLTFPENPGALHVYVGPANATDEELRGLQTINMDVPARLWASERQLRLHPIVIPPYYWFWWLRWCRTFTIRGVVRCPDGNPVPGARVCAFDVDWWWWWSSRQLIRCDTTDATGAFEITFRWCCGWWPWWWWRRRFWQLEPDLVDRIQPILQLDPTLPKIADPASKPSLALFERLLSMDGELVRPPKATLNPADLHGLRKRLLKRLPRVPGLERLKLWPWWPWYPWWDCNPDIIFQVTQDCQGQEQVIVDENIWDTRWNIPTTLDVLLVADENACCTAQPVDPEGNCLVIDSACDDIVADIGGNPPGAPGVAAPTDGFRSPGGGTTWSDRPYAGVIPIHGRFGDGAVVDYYEFEWSADDGVNWDPVPTAAAGSFSRRYWGQRLGTLDPPDWHWQPFNFNEIEDTLGNKHYVVESRRHFEANNDSASWGTTRLWWSQTLDLLMRWKTEGIFTDRRYRLRVKSWRLSGLKLDTWEILPLCGTADPNGIVLTLDNRVMTGGPTNVNGQACGGGTVHLCTTEPDTDIVSVKILHADNTETDVAACGNVTIDKTDKLQIDFVAYDPDGHLADILFTTHYDEDLTGNLLSLGTLSSLNPSPVAWAPAALQASKNYDLAQSHLPPATSPIWHGGAMRLTVDPATRAFPETCCYLLRLTARKRTIFNCDDDAWTHINRSERSFMIQV